MAPNASDPTPSGLDITHTDTKIPLTVPVGLDFGPTSVSVTFFINEREFHTGVPCSELYQSFFRENLSNWVQCNLKSRPGRNLAYSAPSPFIDSEKATELLETLAGYIISALHMGISALDHYPALRFKLMAVTVPDNWDRFARTLVATAARLAGHPLDSSKMILPQCRATQVAFQMSRYNKGKYLTLLLHYNRSYLHMALVEMWGESLEMKGQVYIPRFGEDELHKAPVSASTVNAGLESAKHNSVDVNPVDGVQNNEPFNKSHCSSDFIASNHHPCDDHHLASDLATVSQDNDDKPDRVPLVEDNHVCHDATRDHYPIDLPTTAVLDRDNAPKSDEFFHDRTVCHNKAAHFKPAVKAVQKFLVWMAAPESSTPAKELLTMRYTNGDVRNAVRDVKYIVVDGEASIAGLRDFRDAIKKRFGAEGWMKVETSTRNCGAYGAALAAKQQLQNPKHLGDWKDLPQYTPRKAE